MADDNWLPAGMQVDPQGCTRCGGLAWNKALHDATFHPHDDHEPNEEQG